MFVTNRAEKTFSGMSSVAIFIQGNVSCARQDTPEFSSMFMTLQTEFFSGIHPDYLYRRLFVQGKALEVAPRTFFFFIMCETFHVPSIYRNPDTVRRVGEPTSDVGFESGGVIR